MTIQMLFRSSATHNIALQNAGFLNVEEALNKAGFDVQTRGEKLSIEDFCRLSKVLSEYGAK